MNEAWLQKCYGPWKVGKWNWLLVRRWAGGGVQFGLVENDTTEAGFYERLLKRVEELNRLVAFRIAVETEGKYDKAALLSMREDAAERAILAMMVDKVEGGDRQ